MFLKSGAAAAGVVAVGWGRSAGASAPKAEITDVRTISLQPSLYCGWPTVTRQASGRLQLVYSGGRESHVCPFGRVESMVSDDNGESWTWPRVLLDSAIDDRDAGVMETAQGTLLVTSFSSLAYEPILKRELAAGKWEKERLAKWQAVHRRLDERQRQLELGTWMLRSTDGGIRWSAKYDCLVNSPHGPTQLKDGRVLFVGKQLWRQKARVGVAQSSDDGQTWEWLAEIPAREGDDPDQYHELYAIEAEEGRIIAQIRNHNKQNAHETLQTESLDGGQTWSTPHSIGVWGYPSHLLKLQDGRLLMTYGHRRKPVGNQARVSTDGGRTWSDPIVIYGEAHSTDMGYPTTVEVGPNELLSVWYEVLPTSARSVLRQSRWRLV